MRRKMTTEERFEKLERELAILREATAITSKVIRATPA